jgi:hypothetical protein
VIAIELARRLRDAGLVWRPAMGDRFAIPDRDMDDDVFVLSNMTIEIHTRPEGRFIGFNGTTEWALDDLAQDEAVWLPREDQLRSLLGAAFRRLERTPDGYRVETVVTGDGAEFVADNAEQAYGYALLKLIESALR